MRTPEQLRCGTRIRTKNGWYNIVRIWIKGGKTHAVDLIINNKEQTFNAAELCRHIIDWEPV